MRIYDNIVRLKYLLIMNIMINIQIVRMELLHLAINGRKNSFIKKVLETLCSYSNEEEKMRAKCTLEKGVLYVTLNDDPETLEEILGHPKPHVQELLGTSEDRTLGLQELPRDMRASTRRSWSFRRRTTS